MEKITHIEIKNFKSIRHAEIKDCRRVNVFIGYPNVGKSNILEALGLLSFISKKRPNGLEKLIRFEKFAQLFHLFNLMSPIEISINDNFSFCANYEDESQINLYIKDKININQYLKPGFQSVHVGKKQIYSGSTFGVDNFFGYSLVTNNLVVKPYHFTGKDNFNKSISAIDLKFPIGENLFEVIINNTDLKHEFVSLLKPYEINLIIEQSDSSIKISPKKSNHDGLITTFPITMLAETLIRLIFYKAAITSNTNTVLLFEEPEAQMFPPYIKKFTSDILFDENDNQYFIATHSPYVLGEFIEEMQDDLAVYVVDYDKGETIIKRLTDEEVLEVAQYGIDLFFNLESYLDKNG